MRLSDIEAWTHSIVEQVERRDPIEDSRIELKRTWPDDPSKAARRLAGHANAAYGEPILWIIGLDEDDGIVGAERKEMADWMSGVESQFDGLAPSIQDVVVPCESEVLVALLIDTERAPFVVKNPVAGQQGGGPVALEVPWRAGTKVRSARRQDLLRILVPVSRLPNVQFVDAELQVDRKLAIGHPSGPLIKVDLTANLYLMSAFERRIAIPFHECEASATLGLNGEHVVLDEIEFSVPRVASLGSAGRTQAASDVAVTSDSSLFLSGPEKVQFRAWTNLSYRPEIAHSVAKIEIKLFVAGVEKRMVCVVDMPFDTAIEDGNLFGRWKTTTRAWFR